MNLQTTNNPSSLVITWLMMPLLLFFSLSGKVRLDTVSSNSAYAATFTSFVGNSSDAAIAKVTAIAVVLALALISFIRPKAVISVGMQNLAFTSLGALALCSCLWSQFSSKTIFNGILILANIVFAFFIANRFPPDSRLQLLTIVGWVVVLFSISAAVFFPAYGLDHRELNGTTVAWVGIFGHKNWCAIMVAFLLSARLYLPTSGMVSKLERVAYVALSLFLIYETQSRTGWIVTIAMLVFIACEKTTISFSRRDRGAVVAILMGCGLVMAFFLWQNSGILLLLLETDSSLTGRTGIWQLVFQSAMKHPILGYGYNAFWSGLQGESANISLADHWIVPAAHNGLLDLWLGLGGVGVLLFAFTLLRAIRESIYCLRKNKSPFTEWCLCVVFITLIANISEGTIMVVNHLAWILYVLACVGLHQETLAWRLEKTK